MGIFAKLASDPNQAPRISWERGDDAAWYEVTKRGAATAKRRMLPSEVSRLHLID